MSSVATNPQIVYGINETDKGEIMELNLDMNADAQERISYDGAKKNIIAGLSYAVVDKNGKNHGLFVDKDEIVTDDGKDLKKFFSKNPEPGIKEETKETDTKKEKGKGK